MGLVEERALAERVLEEQATVEVLKNKVERLEWGIKTVLDTFKKDAAEGFKSRDKTFAIDILQKAIDGF